MTPLHEFLFQIDGKLLLVRFYDTRELMLVGAKKFGVNGFSEITNGGFVPAYKEDKKDIGIIFINKEDITRPILAHECLHATFEFFRNKNRKRLVSFDWQCDAHEEDFCHVHTDIYRMISEVIF